MDKPEPVPDPEPEPTEPEPPPTRREPDRRRRFPDPPLEPVVIISRRRRPAPRPIDSLRQTVVVID